MSLTAKYVMREQSLVARVPRLRRLLHPSSYIAPNTDTTVFNQHTLIGSILVDRCVINNDESVQQALGTDDELIYLHIERSFEGAYSLRNDLLGVADYIVQHDVLRNSRHVIGMTFNEMARLAERAGFGRMPDISEMKPSIRRTIELAHMAYCAVNGIVGRTYEPAVVFMPTQQFIDTFSTQSVPQEYVGASFSVVGD